MSKIEKVADYANRSVEDVRIEIEDILRENMCVVTDEVIESLCKICIDVINYVDEHKGRGVDDEELLYEVCRIDKVGKYNSNTKKMLVDMGDICQGKVKEYCDRWL